jgi:4'-phosphopantetheinyl transferase
MQRAGWETQVTPPNDQVRSPPGPAGPGFVRRDPVELWFVDLAASGPALDTVESRCARLSPFELKKIAGSVSPASAAERRAAYIALRVVIERHWGRSQRNLPFELIGAGKPVLPGGSGGFSLAHTGGYALIGVTRAGAIGVDLEPDRQPIVADERRARMESAAIALALGNPLPEPRQKRFLQAWVRLEAVAKVDGRGIGRLLTGLGIIGAVPAPGMEFDKAYADGVAGRFSVLDVEVSKGCVAALALDCPLTHAPQARVLPVTADGIEALTASAIGAV